VLGGVLDSVDRDRPGAREHAGTREESDATGVDQSRQTLEESGDHTVLIGIDGRQIDPGKGGQHPKLGGRLCRVGDLGGMQQSLGGDAPHVQARAADAILLDQPDAQAQLSRTQGAGIAPGARTQDEHVEVGHAAPLGWARAVGPSWAAPSLHPLWPQLHRSVV
jgi:hypothetical protein